MSFFIEEALADAGARPAGSGIMDLVLIGGMVVIFYFFLIRPQNKRAKEHKALMESLQKGDEVVTAGGIIGKIVKLNDEFVVIETTNGVQISMQRQSVNATLPKGTLKELAKSE